MQSAFKKLFNKKYLLYATAFLTGETWYFVAVSQAENQTMGGSAERGNALVCLNTNPDKQEEKGLSPLMKLLDFGSEEKLERYLQKSPDIDLNIQDNEGLTPLMYAILFGNLKSAKILLEYGANPDIQDNIGKTSLMYATQMRDPDLVRVLLEYYSNPNTSDKDGYTPLMISACLGDTEIVKDLLKNVRIDPDQKAKDGRTALLVAVEFGQLEIANILLKSGVDLEVTDKFDQDIVSYLAASKNPKMMDAILPYIGYLNEPSFEDGETLLMVASSHGDTLFAEALIRNGVDIEMKDQYGRTALMFAAIKGNADVFNLLIEHGADCEVKDIDHQSVLDYAQIGGNKSIIDYLNSKKVSKQELKIKPSAFLRSSFQHVR